MNRVVFSIGQVNDYVRSLMKRDPILNEIWIRGEISNLATPASGHMYFTLKDDSSRIRCIMFRQDGEGLSFLPSDGMQVIIKGQISLYCKGGQYQLYAYEMEPDGMGELYAAFEALKDKLENEGLFDPNYKKNIPVFPKKIAVITSHTGAAVRDIINVTRRRHRAIDILIVPVLVQGENSAAQISAAIDYVNTRDDIDVIIVGRGGGSLEELWAFNEEKVARAIWRSDIPVVSAVGHETDNTIADFVADLRAPTPSAAAELIAPDMVYYRQLLTVLTNRLYDSVQALFKSKVQALSAIKGSYPLRYPNRIISAYNIELDQLDNKLLSHIEKNIVRNREQLVKLSTYLDALSPLKVLSRGYAVITDANSEVVHSVNQVCRKEAIDINLQDGIVNCQVIDIDVEKNK